VASQKERMLAGLGYVASDPELRADANRARMLCARFNDAPADDDARRRAALEDLLGGFGEDAVIRPRFLCDYGYNIRIGRRTFVNFDTVMLDVVAIDIGADVQIAPRVQLLTADHPLDADERRTGVEFGKPIGIGDGVWLGGGVIVCPGVEIGENTVVAAGAVVAHSLPAGVLAAGVPARVVRYLS
jgi:maltose O-acetyltransferase